MQRRPVRPAGLRRGRPADRHRVRHRHPGAVRRPNPFRGREFPPAIRQHQPGPPRAPGVRPAEAPHPAGPFLGGSLRRRWPPGHHRPGVPRRHQRPRATVRRRRNRQGRIGEDLADGVHLVARSGPITGAMGCHRTYPVRLHILETSRCPGPRPVERTVGSGPASRAGRPQGVRTRCFSRSLCGGVMLLGVNVGRVLGLLHPDRWPATLYPARAAVPSSRPIN